MDENQIKQALTCCAEFLCGECPYQIYEDPRHIMKCIHMLIVDVENMINKRGEWAIDQEDLEWGNAVKRRYCTNCNERPYFDKEERVFILTDFCPHCGADMRGERNDAGYIH